MSLVLGVDDDRHILVPIGAARLREDGHDVLIERLPVQGLAGAPVYNRGAITRDYETSLREYYGATAATVPADYYKDDLYDDSHLRTRKEDKAVAREAVAKEAAAEDAVAADAAARDASALPRVGDNEVTVPLVADQEVVVRRPGTDEEIIIRKNKTGETTSRD